uniref:Uncharacterized protein n=1 Tax=Arundo donax TaxID=35708 RepID=A0A0A9BG41_ARUDO
MPALTRNAPTRLRWSPCSWMILPRSSSSRTTPLQQSSRFRSRRILS